MFTDKDIAAMYWLADKKEAQELKEAGLDPSTGPTQRQQEAEPAASQQPDQRNRVSLTINMHFRLLIIFGSLDDLDFLNYYFCWLLTG